MKTERSGNKLIIRETPGFVWIFALFFALIGSAFVYGSLGGYSNYDEISRWAAVAHLIGGIAAIGAGYWLAFSAPMTRVTIDRDTETVTHKTRGISRKSDMTYRFDEIEKFRLIEKPDFDSDFVYSLGLELKDGKVIEISAIQSPVESFKRDLVFKANEFTYKQMPSYSRSFELEDET